ncbi:MAG: sulfotransferase [Woeseiaceae bacterium]|nr:sulfotransferase [Woeseiaceae bacterium]NIP20979.1 sulfotransferase [Woeseiaceae bacterium]NIS89959.1 sulfotransferase [Woeseiaceae bacterium]
MAGKPGSESTLQHVLLHPLISSGFGNLVRLVAAYGCDARYAPRLAYLLLVTLLRQPVIWWEAARYGRRVREQRIVPPVFIIGHWRSGTTHLHNVMAQDPQFGRVTLLQAGMPNDFLTLSRFAIKRVAGQLPDKRLMDDVPVYAAAPWEEEMALTSTGRMSFYHVSFFPRSMGRIFNEAVMFDGGDPALQATWKQQYLAFLRKVQFAEHDKPLLLKNPANTARITLLREMFPGARFVHIRRNPYKVYVSSIHLYLKAQEAWGLHKTSRESVAEQILDTYPQLMNAYFEQRGELREHELVEVRYKDLQDNPMELMASIYEQLDLPGFADAAPRFEAYLDSQRDYKKNVLPITPEEKALVAERWRPIFDKLGYPL